MGEAENVYESSNEDNDNGNDPEFVPSSDAIERTDVKDEPQSDLDDTVVEGTFVFNVDNLFNLKHERRVCIHFSYCFFFSFKETKKRSPNLRK